MLLNNSVSFNFRLDLCTLVLSFRLTFPTPISTILQSSSSSDLLVVYKIEYDAKSRRRSVKNRLLRKVISRKSKIRRRHKNKRKFKLDQWGTQERKFNFVKKFLHGIISGSTQEKIHPHKNHLNEQVVIEL